MLSLDTLYQTLNSQGNVIQPAAPTVPGLVLRGAVDQVNPLLEAQDSTGSPVATITAAGVFHVIDPAGSESTVPTMTSASAPSPYAVASSGDVNTFNAKWMAFDNSTTTSWLSDVATGWLRIDLGATGAEVIASYSILGAIAGYTTYAPKTWTFEGSNDASAWTVLDIQTTVGAWSADEIRSYTIGDPASYRYYRINISLNQGGSYAGVGQLNVLRVGHTILKGSLAKVIVGSNADASAQITSPATSFSVVGSKELVLREDGDTFGSSILRLRARGNELGAILDTSEATVNLADVIFATGLDQRNIRYESRNSDDFLNAPEFQFGTPGAPRFVVSDDGSLARSGGVGQIVLMARAAASQTANLQEWQDSTATALTAIDKDGKLGVFAGIADAVNLAVGSTTGTKIGTATTQKLGFFNAAPVVQPSAYTVSNVTPDRSYDASLVLLPEIANVLGTLIADLQSLGLIG